MLGLFASLALAAPDALRDIDRDVARIERWTRQARAAERRDALTCLQGPAITARSLKRVAHASLARTALAAVRGDVVGIGLEARRLAELRRRLDASYEAAVRCREVDGPPAGALSARGSERVPDVLLDIGGDVQIIEAWALRAERAGERERYDCLVVPRQNARALSQVAHDAAIRAALAFLDGDLAELQRRARMLSVARTQLDEDARTAEACREARLQPPAR